MTEAEFIATVLRNPVNATILARLPQLEAPDAWIAPARCSRPCGTC